MPVLLKGSVRDRQVLCVSDGSGSFRKLAGAKSLRKEHGSERKWAGSPRPPASLCVAGGGVMTPALFYAPPPPTPAAESTATDAWRLPLRLGEGEGQILDAF